MASLPTIVDDLDVAGAKLPAVYEAARTALAQCERVDECKGWADKAAALASYARQADDDFLYKTAVRIQANAIRRCGELLDQFKSVGGRPAETPHVSEGSFPASKKEAAEQAGMSRRQMETAVRVANVPANDFEALVESDTPPTITQLADMGKATAEREAVHPSFHDVIVLGGFVRRLAEFTADKRPEPIIEAIQDYQERELRANIAKVRRWLKLFSTAIRS